MTGWESFWLGFNLIGGTLILNMTLLDYMNEEIETWQMWVFTFVGVGSLMTGIHTLITLVR